MLLAEMGPHYERCTTIADSCGRLQCKDTYYKIRLANKMCNRNGLRTTNPHSGTYCYSESILNLLCNILILNEILDILSNFTSKGVTYGIVWL